MTEQKVCNLEFPPHLNELTISGFRFYRSPDYAMQLPKLQHEDGFSIEVPIKPNIGAHAHTAHVVIPFKKQKKNHIQWSGSLPESGTGTELHDILLLLSLFTGRDVFIDNGDATNLLRDSRLFAGGRILRASIPFVLDKDKVKTEKIFEREMNRIYDLIRSSEWKETYGNGYFLVLARHAFHNQAINFSFSQCWTIWEHLFAILNKAWMSEQKIEIFDAAEKIAFLLNKYVLPIRKYPGNVKKIEVLARIRNRLVHYGDFPIRKDVIDEAILFTHITEFIIAKVLGLTPSEIYNTKLRLEAYLKKNVTQ